MISDMYVIIGDNSSDMSALYMHEVKKGDISEIDLSWVLYACGSRRDFISVPEETSLELYKQWPFVHDEHQDRWLIEIWFFVKMHPFGFYANKDLLYCIMLICDILNIQMNRDDSIDFDLFWTVFCNWFVQFSEDFDSKSISHLF